MVMLRVDIKLRLDFNQLPLKMQIISFHVLLINKTCLNSTMNSSLVVNLGQAYLVKVTVRSIFFV